MIIRKHKQFEKLFKTLDRKIQIKVIETLEVFIVDPFADFLRNHALIGMYRGTRSITVSGDYRIIFRQISPNTYEIIELLKVGTHSELYS